MIRRWISIFFQFFIIDDFELPLAKASGFLIHRKPLDRFWNRAKSYIFSKGLTSRYSIGRIPSLFVSLVIRPKRSNQLNYILIEFKNGKRIGLVLSLIHI